MSYNYKELRHTVFTEDGVGRLLRIKQNCEAAIKVAGCVRMDKAISGVTGIVWEMLAAVDYLCETGFLREVSQVCEVAGQYRIFERGAQ